MSQAPKVLFYVQHLLGIGHLARASRICSALADEGCDVTIVTGGTPVSGFPGPNVQHIELPEVRSDSGFSGLADASGEPVDQTFLDNRRDKLLAACRKIGPDVVVTEAFPFGRRQMRFELMPLMEEIHGMARRPRLVASVRDILQERSKPGRDEESASLARTYYDRVLVHGDPNFVRIEETFPLAAGLKDLVSYTGLVAPPTPEPSADRFDVIVSAGGGAVGGALLAAGLEASHLMPDVSWALIGGTNLPAENFEALAASLPPNVRLFRFRKDFAGLLKSSRLSVSQAGYNTVCDVLRAGCRSILVPFVAGGETEQTARASRLERLGLARTIAEAKLSGPILAQAASDMLQLPPPPAAALDLDGARNSAAMIRALAQH